MKTKILTSNLPLLKNWMKDGFGKHQPRAVDFAGLRDRHDEELGHIDRVHCSSLSVADFVTRYENTNTPLIIADVPEIENWKAAEQWISWDWMSEAMGQRLFKCGEDDDGYKVKIKLDYFLKYLRKNQDDSPLYIFDTCFEDDKVSSGAVLDGYKPPSYFAEDFFALVGEKKRPPYRWFLVGPARSGTCVHTDPLATSAWNTVLRGRKRWVLFPPSTLKRVAKALDVIEKGEDDEAVNYFVDFLPRLRMKYGSELQTIEFTQYPGETVFVPGGWWHAVINLDDTVAITQNFCSRANFVSVWKQTRGGRKKMAVKWLRLLHELHPDLAAKAELLNQEDGFVMYDKKAKEQAKAQKEKEQMEKEIEKEEGEQKAAKVKKNKSNKTKSSSSISSKIEEVDKYVDIDDGRGSSKRLKKN